MGYVRTKLNRPMLDVLLGAPRMAIAAYLLLCDLKANLGAGETHPAGWLGSCRRLTEEYNARTGKTTGSERMGVGCAWLEDNGLLFYAPGPKLQRYFILAVPHDTAPKTGALPSKRGRPQNEYPQNGGSSAPKTGAVVPPKRGQSRTLGEGGKRGSARERAFGNPQELVEPVGGEQTYPSASAFLAAHPEQAAKLNGKALALLDGAVGDIAKRVPEEKPLAGAELEEAKKRAKGEKP